jgi:hypothetical protein
MEPPVCGISVALSNYPEGSVKFFLQIDGVTSRSPRTICHSKTSRSPHDEGMWIFATAYLVSGYPVLPLVVCMMCSGRSGQFLEASGTRFEELTNPSSKNAIFIVS